MKLNQIIDSLPSIFGIIALIGLLTSHPPASTSYWGFTGLSPIMMWGAGILALLASLTSIRTAQQRHVKVYTVNVVWLILVFAMLGLFALEAFVTPLKFTF